MRIVYFGTPQFAVPSLETLIQHPDFEVVAVVTQPDKRRGRGSQVMPSPVKQVAIAAGIPVLQPRRIKKDAEALAKLAAIAADAFVVVAYGQILSPDILAMPRLGCINAHGSILPAYRGAAPIQWCLYHGEIETGVTTMQMDAGMDTGPILLTQTLPIGLFDHAWDVAQALAALSATLLVETLQKLDAQQISPIPQADDRATYAPLIQKTDFGLDWTKPAIALHNQVRGFYPNGETAFRGKPLKVVETVPIDAIAEKPLPPEIAAWQPALQGLAPTPSDTAPGTVIAVLKGIGPVLQTGAGRLLLKTVKPSGKKEQSGWDFANGNRITAGETFEPHPSLA